MKFKKILSLVIVIVLIVTAFSACGGNDNDTGTTLSGNPDNGPTTASKTIAVVAKGESHAFWQAVKSGAEDAAKKYGYNITFRGPASESSSDLPSQKEMVQTALSNNVSGLVIATIGEGFADMLTQAYDKKYLLYSSTAVSGKRILKLLTPKIRIPLFQRLQHQIKTPPHLTRNSSSRFSRKIFQTRTELILSVLFSTMKLRRVLTEQMVLLKNSQSLPMQMIVQKESIRLKKKLNRVTPIMRISMR